MASRTDTPAPAAPASADGIILSLGREIGRLFNEQPQLETRQATDPWRTADDKLAAARAEIER